MGFDQSFANCQAKAQSAELAPAALLKGVKDPGQGVAVYAAARIFDFNLKLSAGIIAASNKQPAVVGREFDGVFDQIPKDLLKPRGICAQVNPTRLQLRLELESFLRDVGLTDFQRISQQGVSVDDLET